MVDTIDDNIGFYFKHCLKDIPGCIYFKNPEGIYLACSDYMIHSSNLTSQYDVIGKTDYEIFTLEQANILRENDIKVLEQGETIKTEEKITLPNGETRYFQVIKAPYRNSGGKIMGIIGNSIDITEKKLAEVLAKEKERAEQKIQNLRVLGSTIAHELRNPLGAITLQLDLINNSITNVIKTLLEHNQSFYEKEFAEEFIHIFESQRKINEVIKYTSTTINLLLNNIKEEEISTEKFKAAEISHDIQIVIDNFPFKQGEKQKVNYDKQNFTYWGNPNLTKLIITNLLKNSLYHIKTTNKGEIHISTKEDTDNNYLVVYDNGPGITAELLPKIFTRFVSGRPGGTGLGLAFCKMVMQVFNGDITCQSKKNEYTEFTLKFPKIQISNEDHNL